MKKKFVLICMLFTSFIFCMDKDETLDESLSNQYFLSPSLESLVGDLNHLIFINRSEEIEQIIKTYPSVVSFKSRNTCLSGSLGPLHNAVDWGRYECAKKLLQNGFKPDGSFPDTEYTPLFYARSGKIVRLLLNYGAEVNRKTKGKTPLWAFCSHQFLNRSKRIKIKKKEEIAILLLKNGADINTVNEKGKSLLHDAVKRNCEEMLKFLLERKADTNKRNNKGLTAFEYAIQKYIKGQSSQRFLNIFEKYGMLFFPQLRLIDLSVKMVQLCHFDGAEPEFLSILARLFIAAQRRTNHTEPNMFVRSGLICNQHGCIAHHISKEDIRSFLGKYYEEIKEYLISVCKNTMNDIGINSSDRLAKRLRKFPWIIGYNSDLDTQMAIKAMRLVDKECLRLLLENELNPSNYIFYDGSFDTLFHYAVSFNLYDVLELFIQYKGNYLLRSSDLTPLEYAVSMEKKECISVLNKQVCLDCQDAFFRKDYKKSKKLIPHIVDCNVPLDENNRTLLHDIANSLSKKAAKFIPLLIAQGADPNWADKHGVTALWRIVSYREEKELLLFFKMLLEAGADVNKRNALGKSLLAVFIFRENFELAKLCLEYDAIIDKALLEKCTLPEDFKRLLEQKYNAPACCICLGYPKNMSIIPCDNLHSEMLCKECYDVLRKKCPLCRGELGEFTKEVKKDQGA